ncbi:RICIN domain-containing protein [Actinoplanes sp. NPDC051851]|uniref:ricin-type beta-trefoil lectin domain protein n=1 Tax=Actinoplanes sp. NPDC051851 TaxID=3154753 RepID=UPI00341E87FB
MTRLRGKGARQDVTGPVTSFDAAAVGTVHHALRVLATGAARASRSCPPVYAILLEPERIQLRLAAVDDDPPEPWQVEDGGLSWSAPLHRLESAAIDEAIAVTPRRLVTLGVDGDAAVFLDLGQADGLIGLSGEPEPLRRLVSDWTTALVGQQPAGAARVLLVGLEPPAVAGPVSSAVACTSTVLEAIAEMERGGDTVTPSADRSPVSGFTGFPEPSGVLVLGSPPGGPEASRLQALVTRDEGWAVVVLGGYEGARWNLTLQRDGRFDTGTLGLMSTPETVSVPAPGVDHVRRSTMDSSDPSPRERGRSWARWLVPAAGTVALVAAVAIVAAVLPIRSEQHNAADAAAAVHVTTPSNAPSARGSAPAGGTSSGTPAGGATSGTPAPGGGRSNNPAPGGATPGTPDVSGSAATSPTASASSGASAEATTDVVTGPTGQIVGKDDKCIGLANGEVSSGTAVDVYSCVSGSTQKWTIATDGTIRNSGMCMAVANGSTSDGAAVQIRTCNNTAAQQWVYNSSYDLLNAKANKCLDMTGNSSDNYTSVQIWTCTGGANQKWIIPS